MNNLMLIFFASIVVVSIVAFLFSLTSILLFIYDRVFKKKKRGVN